MILKAFAIRDSKSEHFNQPWFKSTQAQAERDFHTITNDPKSTINSYPDDFDLYYLGEYDDQKGIFTSLDTPLHLKKAVQCINKDQ